MKPGKAWKGILKDWNGLGSPGKDQEGWEVLARAEKAWEDLQSGLGKAAKDWEGLGKGLRRGWERLGKACKGLGRLGTRLGKVFQTLLRRSEAIPRPS